ncbi:TPA: ead/Ea22-like family protein [Serratia marcescens]
MDKFSELKAAALAATPGRIGDRIDGSGSIKYECTGYDGSLVLLTDHKDMEYGFVGDNADADELFFRLCVPDVVLALLAELEFEKQNNAGFAGMVEDYETKLEAKDERIAELETHNVCLIKKNADLTQQNIKLGEQLATPVRLPDIEFVKISGIDFPVMRADIVKKEIRHAGFKVEGDEQ